MIGLRDETLAGPAQTAKGILGDAAAPCVSYIEGDPYGGTGVWTESQWRPAPCRCDAPALPANHRVGELDFRDGIPGPVGCGCHEAFEDRTSWFDVDAPAVDRSVADPAGPPLPPSVVEVVDIYLSAGPHDDGDRSCQPNNYTGCSLWRIRLDLATKSALSVEELQSRDGSPVCMDGTTHLQPAVSPDGKRYAWQRTCFGAFGGGSSVRIVSQSIAREGLDPPVTVAMTEALPMYPNWFDDHTVIFTHGSPSNLSSVVDWATAAVATTELGPNGLRGIHYSWNDAYTSATPADSTVPGRPRIVTFGGFLGAAGEFHLPQVADLHGHDVTHFDIPQADWQPPLSPDPPECHHPAWNPDGTRILCTRYQGPEHVEGDTQTTDETVTYDLRRLYQFEWDGTEWVRYGGTSFVVPAAGAMVEALTGSEFNLISRDTSGAALNVFLPRFNKDADAEGCGAYVWKFAEWCASSRYVVATVYCTDNTSSEQGKPLHSRVVLIDTENTGSHLGYTDLVTIIEYWLDGGGTALLGTYSGVFSTCTPVADNEFLAGAFA